MPAAVVGAIRRRHNPERASCVGARVAGGVGGGKWAAMVGPSGAQGRPFPAQTQCFLPRRRWLLPPWRPSPCSPAPALPPRALRPSRASGLAPPTRARPAVACTSDPPRGRHTQDDQFAALSPPCRALITAGRLLLLLHRHRTSCVSPAGLDWHLSNRALVCVCDVVSLMLSWDQPHRQRDVLLWPTSPPAHTAAQRRLCPTVVHIPSLQDSIAPAVTQNFHIEPLRPNRSTTAAEFTLPWPPRCRGSPA
jgi:hypothetical protein